jgi:hypothetical protein
VSGTVQGVQNPAVLLGLYCWHIYPDILVLGQGKSEPLKQKDALVECGGLLTVGMQLNADSEHSIFWSLPLSFLRWYGDSVVARGCIGPDSSRVTANELRFIAVGSVFAKWSMHFDNNDVAATFALDLFNMFNRPGSCTVFSQLHCYQGFRMMSRVCEDYLESQGEERLEYNRMIAFGRRREVFASNHCSDLSKHDMECGCPTIRDIISILPSDKSRFTFLRSFKSVINPKNWDRFVIICPLQAHAHNQYNSEFYLDPRMDIELASLYPVLRTTSFDQHSFSNSRRKVPLQYCRWRHYKSSHENPSPFCAGEPCLEAPSLLLHILEDSLSDKRLPVSLAFLPNSRINANGTFSDIDRNLSYFRIERISPFPSLPPMDPSSVLQTLESKGESLDSDPLYAELESTMTSVALAIELYNTLPGATISPKIFQRPMLQIRRKPSREEAFALAAYCDSGANYLVKTY